MQLNRLFEIVYLLMERPVVTAAELAKRFEVSTRTVYRDVEALSQAGVPIYMSKGRGGGISLLPDFVLNKAVLSKEERENVVSALQGFSAASVFSGKRSDKALSKLSALFGEGGGSWIEIDFSDWGPRDDVRNTFERLKEAVLEQRIATFSYFSGKGQESSREVEPLKIVFKGQGWYLYAFCRTRREERFFKLSRMRHIELCDERFMRQRPGTVVKKDDWQEEVLTVQVKIKKEMAFRVYDEFAGNFAQDDAGDFIIHLRVERGPFLWGYLLSFGEHLSVLSPDEIRRELQKQLQNALKNYENTEN